MIIKIQNGDFMINTDYVSEIEVNDEDEWEVTMITGQTYTLEGDDIKKLCKYVEID